MEPTVPQASFDLFVEQVTHANLEPLSQYLLNQMGQGNREDISFMNLNVGAIVIRVRNFTIINLIEFHGSKVDEDPKEILNEMYKTVKMMKVSMVEKV